MSQFLFSKFHSQNVQQWKRTRFKSYYSDLHIEPEKEEEIQIMNDFFNTVIKNN